MRRALESEPETNLRGRLALVRAFIRWLGTNGFTDLTGDEQERVKKFFAAANKALA